MVLEVTSDHERVPFMKLFYSIYEDVSAYCEWVMMIVMLMLSAESIHETIEDEWVLFHLSRVVSIDSIKLTKTF